MISSMSVQNVDFATMTNFTYKWNLTDLKKVEKNGLKVFSCFSCGGGSTMGYKMSGFDVIGCRGICPERRAGHKKSGNPKYPYLESIETFKLRDDLPKELYNLDILDGSPPCSSFSMAGSREKKWGKKKKFREGQADQILDDLFFHYIELAHKLRPKVVIAENVKGMLMGNAKGYVKQIIALFKSAGYDVQLFLLNGATMGLPQKRERVFFVCKRKDLDFPKLELSFKETPIVLKEAFKGCNIDGKNMSSSSNAIYWNKCKPGKSFSSVHPRGSLFNSIKLHPDKPANTLPASGGLFHWKSNRLISKDEACVISSFPYDYKFRLLQSNQQHNQG